MNIIVFSTKTKNKIKIKILNRKTKNVMHHPHTTQLFAKINTVLEFFKDEQQVSSANFTSLGNVAAGGGGSLPVGGVVSVGVGVGVGGTGQSEIGNLLQVKDGTVVESFLIEVLIVLDYLRFEKEVEMSGGRVKGKDPRPKLELGGLTKLEEKVRGVLGLEKNGEVKADRNTNYA